MRRQFAPLPVISLLIILTACQTAPAATPIETHSPIPLRDTILPTPLPTTPIPTATLAATPTPTATPSATPFAPFHAVTVAAAVRLRAGPGYLFLTLRSLPEGGPVTVLGKAPGGEWIRVRTPEKVEGWVFWRLLLATVDVLEAPIIQPQNVPLIQGRVLDAGGTPIQGISFDVVQGKQTAIGNNSVLTDSSGEFFAFLPAASKGSWTVSQTGIACESNVWTDASCTYYKNGYKGKVDPPSVDVVLPTTGVLQFTWS